MPLKNIPAELRPKYEDCLTKVRAKGGGNEYAICYASVVEGASAEQILERFAVTPEVMDIVMSFSQEKNDSETIAIEPFKAIDPSQPLKILPIGKFYRGDRVLNIDDARAREIVSNFQAGLPRYGVAVNVEHGEDANQPGKIGRVKSVKYVPGDGIYADRVEYTDSGKKLLADERFDAPSPEVVWTLNNNSKYQDPETGKWHDNVLVGLALTNSPFFGGHVAVFSDKPNKGTDVLSAIKNAVLDALKERFGNGPGIHDVHIDSALASKKLGEEDFAEWDTAYVNNLPDSAFAYVEDGEKDESGKTIPRSKRHLPYKGSDGKIDLPHLRNALARLSQTDIGAEGKAAAQKKLNAAATSAGVGDKEKSAMAKNAESFQMDHGDMTSHHGSDGKPDAAKVKAALGKDGLADEEKKHMQDHLKAMQDEETAEGEKASARQGGTRMSSIITAEEFAAVKTKAAQVDEFKAKLEAAEAESKKLAEQFASERLIRRTAEYAVEAEKFAAIPTPVADLGKHLLWLDDADTSEKKDHFAYFKSLLETANKALVQSALFERFGTGRSAPDSNKHPFLAEVERIRVERFKDKEYSIGYAEAFKAVSAENKTLAAQYVTDKQSGRV